MKLKTFRTLARMSQRQMAQRLGVTELSVIKYEQGANIPSFDVMRSLYRVTSGAVAPNDFYDLDKVPLAAPRGGTRPDLDTDTLLAVGLMSGTSMDGIDGALLATNGESIAQELGAVSMRYDAEFTLLLKAAERAVREAEGNLGVADEKLPAALDSYLGECAGVTAAARGKVVEDLAHYLTGNRTGEISLDAIVARSTDLHAAAVKSLLEESGYRPRAIDVIGYHGQTLFHRPQRGITVQAGDGARLATSTKIPVVYDFRSNDVAHGGQGAPFAPLYHAAVAAQVGLAPVVIANCGGIANITVVTGKDEELYAFDTGPGNSLVDRFVQKRLGKPCDMDGMFGRQGRVADDVLRALVERGLSRSNDKSFFEIDPPKSLDVGDLNLVSELDALTLQDGCATLEAFTAECIARGAESLVGRGIAVPHLWVVAGGGWKNPVIFEETERRLARVLGGRTRVQHAEKVGWNSDTFEAQIFAYLAVRSLKGLPLSLPGTTGVPRPLTGGKTAFPGGDPSRATVKVRALDRSRSGRRIRRGS